MCTVVVGFAPDDQVPLLLLGIRDEFTARPWQPPARHWPGSPLIGGLDEQAGGTWLAVHPSVPRVSCVLNGRGDPAPQPDRQSRGNLPLIAASHGDQAVKSLHDDARRLASYDPFHLIHADLTEVTLLSWNGRVARYQRLQPGTHIITNSGLDPDDPKATYFGPEFGARRPSGALSAGIRQAWSPWLELAGHDALDPADPRAIRVRRTLPDGRAWGTTSVSLVALAASGLRYDFQPVPGDPKPVTV